MMAQWTTESQKPWSEILMIFPLSESFCLDLLAKDIYWHIKADKLMLSGSIHYLTETRSKYVLHSYHIGRAAPCASVGESLG